MSYGIAVEHKLALLRFNDTSAADALRLALIADATGLDMNDQYVTRCAESWRTTLGYTLYNAVPYYWSPECCAALVAAAPGVPDYELQREDIPHRSGYMYFARPLELDRTDDVKKYADESILWHLGRQIAIGWTLIKRPEGAPQDLKQYYGTTIEEREGKTAITGANVDDATEVVLHIIVESKYRPAGTPISTLVWPIGRRLVEVVDAGTGRLHADGKPAFSETSRQQLRYFAAALMFMQQEIFPTRREQLPRDARKRLAREGFDPGALKNTPHVVYLRRITQRPNDDAEHVARDYDHRFWVKGHWRNQWYPTEQRHKPRWIHPFIKGPEDKPIAPRRAELVAVVR